RRGLRRRVAAVRRARRHRRGSVRRVARAVSQGDRHDGMSARSRGAEGRMETIIGLAGSLRPDSYNAALLRAAARAMPEGAMLRIESIAGIPLYNGDEEASHGVPAPVARLKDA